MNTLEENFDISRRNFIALAGGVAGMAVLSSFGMPLGWATNEAKIDVD